MSVTKFSTLLLAAAAAGCASAPPATDTIAVARGSIDRAEQAGAAQAAPTELSQARGKLDAAEKASRDHDKKAALRLAQQAEADGKLAEAAAGARRSHEAVAQLDASLKALRDEATRGDQSGAPPPSNP
jgi:hypothetical protein